MNSNTNKTTDLHNVTFLGQPVDIIIFFASIILPFINEIAIIFTKSGYSAFHNLYKVCIHDDVFTMLSETCKANKHIHCSNGDTFRRLFIDALAYLGIILNTIKHGYVTGVVNGFVLVICSIVFPNLYLSKIIKTLKHIFHVNNPIMNIIIGLICIIILIFVTKFLQDLSTKMFQNYRIDKINEPVVKNKTEQEIINYLE